MSQSSNWKARRNDLTIPVGPVPDIWIHGFAYEQIAYFTPMHQPKVLDCIRQSYENVMHKVRREVKPSHVFALLCEAREILTTVYLSQEVCQVAVATKTGPNGPTDPYDFFPEMQRDIATFLLFLSRLTGKDQYYFTFAERLVKYFERIEAESSIKTLFLLEYSLECYRVYGGAGNLRAVEDRLDRAFKASMDILRVSRAADVALKCFYLDSARLREKAYEHFALCVSIDPSLKGKLRVLQIKRFAQPIQRALFRAWMIKKGINMDDLVVGLQ